MEATNLINRGVAVWTDVTDLQPLSDATIAKDVSTGQGTGVLQVSLADGAFDGALGPSDPALHSDPVGFQSLLDSGQHGSGRVRDHRGLVPVLHLDVASDVKFVEDDPLLLRADKCKVHAVANDPRSNGGS